MEKELQRMNLLWPDTSSYGEWGNGEEETRDARRNHDVTRIDER
jgi:hypothetical protein